MTVKELEKKIHTMRELQSFIEDCTAEIEEIKDSIKAEMGQSEELKAGEYKVTYKAVSSCRLDTAALRKALPDVFEKFSKETVIRRFIVA